LLTLFCDFWSFSHYWGLWRLLLEKLGPGCSLHILPLPSALVCKVAILQAFLTLVAAGVLLRFLL
jgi:hypothetical protein